MSGVQPVLVVHGGAWAMPDEAVEAHERGIAKALAAGWAELADGGTAVDAVEAAVRVMEDDDTFDAGRGSFLTQDGRVQMDALLMEGATLRAGGVACVERLRNPISAARLVLERSPHVYFVGTGAERFARQHGMALCENTDLIVPRERERLIEFQRAELAGEVDTTFSGAAKADEAGLEEEAERALPAEVRPFSLADLDPTAESHDTVGAVALDAQGNLAAGTSTGGRCQRLRGVWGTPR